MSRWTAARGGSELWHTATASSPAPKEEERTAIRTSAVATAAAESVRHVLCDTKHPVPNTRGVSRASETGGSQGLTGGKLGIKMPHACRHGAGERIQEQSYSSSFCLSPCCSVMLACTQWLAPSSSDTPAGQQRKSTPAHSMYHSQLAVPGRKHRSQRAFEARRCPCVASKG